MAWSAALAAKFPSVFDEPIGDEVYICGLRCERLGKALTFISPLSFYFRRCSSWITRAPYKYFVPMLILAGCIPFVWVLSQRSVNYDMIGGVMSPSSEQYQAYRVIEDRLLVAR